MTSSYFHKYGNKKHGGFTAKIQTSHTSRHPPGFFAFHLPLHYTVFLLTLLKPDCCVLCVMFLTFFPWYHHKVRVKRYFDPDTELLRALHFRNSKNIRNPLIFLQKMASYSCFWRGPRSKILLQARLRRIFDLFPLVSSYI